VVYPAEFGALCVVAADLARNDDEAVIASRDDIQLVEEVLDVERVDNVSRGESEFDRFIDRDDERRDAAVPVMVITPSALRSGVLVPRSFKL
jgi:hypothetical protein